MASDRHRIIRALKGACGRALRVLSSRPVDRPVPLLHAEQTTHVPRGVKEHFPSGITKSSSMKLTRTEILSLLALKGNYQSYLEIGVQNPKGNFNQIPVREKIGVDPELSAGATFCTTSDAFFAANHRTFDLIFIDGMHEAKQALRDIENSLQILRPGGTIVVHDCNPSTREMQLVPIQTNQWTGDVWKAWVTLRTRQDNLSMRVVDTDYGCGIIREGVNQRLDAPDLKDAQLSWENFVKHRAEWLNLISPADFLATEFPGARLWDDLVIATVGTDTEDFSKYLLESVRVLGNYPVIWRWGTGATCLAREYNKVLRSTAQRFVLFVHPDVEFTPDFLIYADFAFQDPRVGAIGFYGCGMDGLHWRGGPPKCWNSPSDIPDYVHFIAGLKHPVASLDSCCLLVDRSQGVFFDEQLFDGLHLHVEDYCFQQRAQGRSIMVVKTGFCDHHGTTTNKNRAGCAWGDYATYHQKLLDKWRGKLNPLHVF